MVTEQSHTSDKIVIESVVDQEKVFDSREWPFAPLCEDLSRDLFEYVATPFSFLFIFYLFLLYVFSFFIFIHILTCLSIAQIGRVVTAPRLVCARSCEGMGLALGRLRTRARKRSWRRRTRRF